MATSYLVRILVPLLNIRKYASFSSPVVGTVKKGDVYTIVDECNGLGKLKSGVGWISLGSKYVQRISSNTNTGSKPTYVHDFGKCVITNYYGGDELGSGTVGALGKKLTPNRSCASHNLPYGTKVYIEGLKGKVNNDGIFVVEDTGGHAFDFDIFVSKDKSSKVGKQSLDVKVIEWGTNKRIAASYTYIIQYYVDKQKKTGVNYLKRYHAAWEKYKSMGGKLINFWQFNDEDKNIKNKSWYGRL